MKRFVLMILGFIIPLVIFGVYRIIVIQYTVCAPIYTKLQSMSPDSSNERLGLEYTYFSNNCR